jgi:hypothetical protein
VTPYRSGSATAMSPVGRGGGGRRGICAAAGVVAVVAGTHPHPLPFMLPRTAPLPSVGDNVALYPCGAVATRQAFLFDASDHVVVNGSGGTLVWDIAGPSNATGAAIHVWGPYSPPVANQQWLWSAATGLITSAYNGLCVGVPAGPFPNSPLVLVACNGAAATLAFTYNAPAAPLSFALTSTLSTAQPLCLQVRGAASRHAIRQSLPPPSFLLCPARAGWRHARGLHGGAVERLPVLRHHAAHGRPRGGLGGSHDARREGGRAGLVEPRHPAAGRPVAALWRGASRCGQRLRRPAARQQLNRLPHLLPVPDGAGCHLGHGSVAAGGQRDWTGGACAPELGRRRNVAGEATRRRSNVEEGGEAGPGQPAL